MVIDLAGNVAVQGGIIDTLLNFENANDGAYGVSFPDFPGCTTVADNLDAAVAKAAEVLAFHVEGLAEDGPVPEPRSLAELARDPEFRADVKNALAALIPHHPPTRAVRVNITLEESLMERQCSKLSKRIK